MEKVEVDGGSKGEKREKGGGLLERQEKSRSCLLAVLCSSDDSGSLSETEWSMAVHVAERRVVLPVAQVREGHAQQGAHQHV